MGAWLAFGTPAAGSAVLRYAGALLFSCVGGLIPGTLFVLAPTLAPGERSISTTVGWMQQWSAVGQVSGPPLVAWVASQAGGWQLTWMVTGACCAAGMLLAVRSGGGRATWRRRWRVRLVMRKKQPDAKDAKDSRRTGKKSKILGVNLQMRRPSGKSTL